MNLSIEPIEEAKCGHTAVGAVVAAVRADLEASGSKSANMTKQALNTGPPAHRRAAEDKAQHRQESVGK